eukprot:s399_g17.t1
MYLCATVKKPAETQASLPDSCPCLESLRALQFDASVCLEDCQGFVAGLGLPTEIGEALYAELEAEGTLQSSEEIRIPPADMEWLVGHFGPQIDIRFLLYRPQLVPALRRCVDFGLELPKSGLQAEELSEAPDRASTPSCRPASRVGFGSRASTRPPSSAQSPSPRLRSDPWSRQVEDRASEAEDLGLDAEKDASQRVAREWGFERGHGPFPPARRRKPASQWGPETQSLPELQVLAVGTRIRGQLSISSFADHVLPALGPVRGIRHLRSGKDGSHSEPTGAFSRAALGIARRIRKPSAGVNDVNVFCWQRQRLHFNARALLRSVQDSIVNLLANVPKPSESKAKATEMETMVMLLAQQAKLARKQSQGADGNVTELAFANLSVGCPLYSGNTTFLPEGFTGDFTPLRAAHTACRAEIVGKKQELDACKSSRESLISLEQTLTTEFSGINIFESPEDRQDLYKPLSFKGDDVLLYLGSMRDHFKNKQLAWWKTYYKLENVTQNITQWNCTDKEIEYFEKISACQAAQLELEETACQVHERTLFPNSLGLEDCGLGEVWSYQKRGSFGWASLASFRAPHRTNESCASLPACYDAKWSNYLIEVTASNKTIQDLKYEYRAIKRIGCLLDTGLGCWAVGGMAVGFFQSSKEAFSAADMDAAIDACIAERSKCVDSHAGIEKPSFVTPEVCAGGLQSILHPSDPNFNETEYAAQGIEDGANKCLASCCTIDWYSWSTFNNAFVTQDHYMVDADTGRVAAFGTMEEAKSACEMMGSVLCFGIYDTKCDGASEESPVKLIKAPGLDLESVKESNIGSCVLRMKLGSETTVTTTIAQFCSYEVNVSRTDDPSAVWKTYHVEKQEYGEVFRFSGCANPELDEAAECVASGVSNGVRVLKNRHGQAVGTGVCCASATNTVLTTTPIQCDGC